LENTSKAINSVPSNNSIYINLSSQCIARYSTHSVHKALKSGPCICIKQRNHLSTPACTTFL